MEDFYRNIAKVMGGSFASQLIPLIAYPILTRIYSPSEFGTLATVLILATLISIFLSGCYEHAILVTKTKFEEYLLVTYIIRRAIILSLLLCIIITLFSTELSIIFANPDLASVGFLIPIIALFNIYYLLLCETMVRRKKFGMLSVTKILQSGFVVLNKIGLNIIVHINHGLIIGDLTGKFLLVIIFFAKSLQKNFRRKVFVFCRGSSKGIKAKFKDFPRLMIPDQLMNNLSGSLHIFIIGPIFGTEQVGYLALLFSALYLPVTIISTSIKDVFRQKAYEQYRSNGNCRTLLLSTLIKLCIISLPFFLVLFFISPWLFPVVFGAEWSVVGIYAQIMIPMYYANLISMSFSGVLIFTRKIKVSLYWQLINLFVSAIALVVGSLVYSDIFICLYLLAAGRGLSYLLYLLIAFHYAKEKERLVI